ncbi:MAG: 30S ribosomal protein S3ae [Candidatus Bathyarchaeia archaeon]
MSRRGRRIRDKWRMKGWYTIYSPPYFGGVAIGPTPADEANKLLGRVIDATLYDITGDFSQQHLKLHFQVTDVKGNRLETIFKGHEYSRDYLRSLVRRGSTRIDHIRNVTTKDGYTLRLSVVVFSIVRGKTSQMKAVRAVAHRILDEKAASLNFDQFVQEAVLGKIASDIYNEAKRIIPIRHIGVRKSKLIAYPSERVEELEVTV